MSSHEGRAIAVHTAPHSSPVTEDLKTAKNRNIRHPRISAKPKMANPYILMILISVAVTLAYAAGRFEYPLWLMLAGAFAMQLLGYYVASLSTMLVI